MIQDFKHQEEAFQRFKNELYGALFHEQGCGKTRVAIKLAEHHFRNNHISAVFLVTTTGLVGNWSEVELPMHSSLEYNQYRWNTDTRLPTAGPLYFMINIDAIIGARFPPVFKVFFKYHRRFMLIVDESTIAKNSKAKRTKRLLQIAQIAKYKLIMSGTPLVHSPVDLFSQSLLLSPTALGIKTLTTFKARYAETELSYHGPHRRFEKIVGFKNLDELNKKLLTFASIVKKVDCLDIPPKIYRRVYVAFTEEQATAYNELRTRALTYIDDHEISVSNAVSLINKLLQICSGQVKVDGTYLSIPNNRISLTRTLVEEVEGKTIVWTAFVNNATDLATALGPLAVRLPSGLTLEAKAATLRAYKTGLAPALIANPASSGHGITIILANMIYYSRSWNAEHRWQSEDRAHRIGQFENLLITDLLTKGTVEERVLELLSDREIMANLVINNKFIKELLNEPVRFGLT